MFTNDYPDLLIECHDTVAQVELNRPPHNYFDTVLLADLDRALRGLADSGARAAVLCSAGRRFCAGADFSGAVATHHPDTGEHIYDIAIRLFESPLPVIAAVHGNAIGGGLGLAMACDERVVATDATLSANFTRLGFHPGFGLSASLAWTIGNHRAATLLGTGTGIDAATAEHLGVADVVVDGADLRACALDRARVWAEAAPLAVASVRRTMRADLVAAVRTVVGRERDEQLRLAATSDWTEGITAARERRRPVFEGH